MNPILATWHFTYDDNAPHTARVYNGYVEWRRNSWKDPEDYETYTLREFFIALGHCPLTSGELLLSDVLPRIN